MLHLDAPPSSRARTLEVCIARWGRAEAEAAAAAAAEAAAKAVAERDGKRHSQGRIQRRKAKAAWEREGGAQDDNATVTTKRPKQ